MIKLSIALMATVLLFGSLVILNSCTLSFHNISTHGTAEDLIDETQETEPNVSPNISPTITGPLPGV